MDVNEGLHAAALRDLAEAQRELAAAQARLGDELVRISLTDLRRAVGAAEDAVTRAAARLAAFRQ